MQGQQQGAHLSALLQREGKLGAHKAQLHLQVVGRAVGKVLQALPHRPG